MLDAVADTGQADNTLVFYIAGDNGASGEGGANGMFNEYTYFNGVQETVPRPAEADRQVGLARRPTRTWRRAGRSRFDAPFGWMKQVASDFGGTRNGMVVSLAEGDQGEGRDPHAVRPRDRRRPDDPRGGRPARAEGRERHAADPDGGHEPRLHVRRREGQGAPRRPSTSRSPATAPSTTTAGSRGRSTRRRGSRSPARGLAEDTWELYDVRSDFSLSTDLAAKEPKKLEEMKALFMQEAAKHHVLPLDDRLFERLIAAAVGRPDLMAGRTSLTLAEGMTGMMENVFINVKNKSKTITAEVEVPAKGRERHGHRPGRPVRRLVALREGRRPRLRLQLPRPRSAATMTATAPLAPGKSDHPARLRLRRRRAGQGRRRHALRQRPAGRRRGGSSTRRPRSSPPTRRPTSGSTSGRRWSRRSGPRRSRASRGGSRR